ncbi:MAG TPA: exodeoxyribonuclease V subunit alpha [Burkholderiaceae bacterium]
MSSRIARAFAAALARIHDARGAGADAHGGAGADARDALVATAERVWDAARDGHVCVRVEGEPERGALAASPAVSVDARARAAPLVLDAGRAYLYRLHRAEGRLAESAAALDDAAPLASARHTERVLESLYPSEGADPAQRRAVATALSRRLALVSGGPGTGKTTTLARLVLAVSALAPQARIALAAPTGKAAARLSQSLSAELRAASAASGAEQAQLPAGVTVHSLLGLRGQPAGDSAQVGPALAFDLVIVDEASMLDIELASALAQRIGPGARLVLAGDMDQLASVEAGAVFAELCAAGLGGVARLERNYRQQQGAGIVELAAAVREGAPVDAIAAALGDRVSHAENPAEIAAHALERYAPALDALESGAAPGEVLERYERFRVLCALREGPRGVRAINALVAAAARRRAGEPAQSQWYPGRLVMVARNDRETGLFNGDVGVCVDGQTVAFAAAEGGVRSVPVLLMPACEDAWAITVHKSQGSEFDSIAFVAPPEGHPLATRELVYTAITRARNSLRIWGSAQAVAAASATRVVRDGRLAERVIEHLKGR